MYRSVSKLTITQPLTAFPGAVRRRLGLAIAAAGTLLALTVGGVAPAQAYTTCSPGGQGGTETCGPGTISQGVGYSPTGPLQLNIQPGTTVNAGSGESGVLIPGPMTVTTQTNSTPICPTGTTLQNGQCVRTNAAAAPFCPTGGNAYIVASGQCVTDYGPSTSPTNGVCPTNYPYGINTGVGTSATICYAQQTGSTGPVNCPSGSSYSNTTGLCSAYTTVVGAPNQCPTGSTLQAGQCVTTLTQTGTGSVPTTNVSISIAQGAAINAPNNGVDLQTAGSGAITVDNAGTINAGNIGILANSAQGAITLTNSGQITAPVGIVAGSTAGVVNITNSGTIGGATVGIAAGSGAPVTLTNAANGRITFGQLGLAGASASALTLTNNGTLTQDTTLPGQLTQAQLASLPALYQRIAPSSPAAIFGRSFGSDLRVTNAGQIIGQVGIDAAVLNGQSGATGQLTIANSGSITATGGPAIDTRASVAGAQVTNSGTITGYLTLNSDSSFTNSQGGVFNATGNSTFGGGSILNNGTIALLKGSGPVSASLNNVGTLTNAGIIDLRTGTAANTLTIGGNYVGQNGTLLAQASTQAGTSDRLVITGNASGTTGITVANLSPGTTAFSTSPVLVQVNGTTAANAFTLASAQNFGTLQPVLVTGSSNGASTLSIGAAPTAAALQGPTAVVASRTIAQQGSNAILDRVQQLRDTKVAGNDIAPAVATPLAYAPMGYASLISKDPISQNVVQPTAPVDNSVKVATWARATGDLERRTGTSNYTFAGSVFSRDLGYTQGTGALLGGVDAVISGLTKADDGLILGVLGGYTTAEVNLNNNAGRQDYNGGTVGTYATYLNGPWFVDALFKVDLLGLDIIAPGIRQKTGLTNYSFATNVGYRIPLDHGVYIEPTAGLDYVDTQFSRHTTLTAATVPLNNGDALRGRIGTRIGSEVIIDNVRFEPSITTYVYTVLTESNPSGVFNGVTSVTGIRDQGKPRGEVQAALNVFDLKSGISGFVRADMRVGSDLLAGGGRVGVRYTW